MASTSSPTNSRGCQPPGGLGYGEPREAPGDPRRSAGSTGTRRAPRTRTARARAPAGPASRSAGSSRSSARTRRRREAIAATRRAMANAGRDGLVGDPDRPDLQRRWPSSGRRWRSRTARSTRRSRAPPARAVSASARGRAARIPPSDEPGHQGGDRQDERRDGSERDRQPDQPEQRDGELEDRAGPPEDAVELGIARLEAVRRSRAYAPRRRRRSSPSSSSTTRSRDVADEARVMGGRDEAGSLVEMLAEDAEQALVAESVLPERRLVEDEQLRSADEHAR